MVSQGSQKRCLAPKLAPGQAPGSCERSRDGEKVRVYLTSEGLYVVDEQEARKIISLVLLVHMTNRATDRVCGGGSDS